MWQWNDGTGELYHYGVLGMKWGHHKAKVYTAKKKRVGSRRAKKQSIAKTAAQVAIFGGYGTTKYKQARANHTSRGKAAAKATLYAIGNNMTGGLLGMADMNKNRKSSGASAARSKANTSARKTSASRSAKKSYTQKEYVAAHNRAAAKINDSRNHILSDFNKKWEGKYNTTAYQQAYTEMLNKMIEDELR